MSGHGNAANSAGTSPDRGRISHVNSSFTTLHQSPPSICLDNATVKTYGPLLSAYDLYKTVSSIEESESVIVAVIQIRHTPLNIFLAFSG
ncbi:unnamed protein product [Acanthoscelides obtectus]|uniref:Uncharacterized protein n=1 Tax=Acanthoscelides obtectus TaxID=200917 RepID=A0A9P0LGX0_ACAOB|nr:unnamed protein product [Acanthoscelides obtectus]CAK1668274.1 hypothetical protein AOBTE_LOCUS26308 [Acanthoscelides obtectus]